MADGPDAPRATTADPGGEGGHRVVTSDYTQPGIKLPGLRDPVEMVGHVEAPADASRTSPLVVLLHGRHPTCFRGERQDVLLDARGPHLVEQGQRRVHRVAGTVVDGADLEAPRAGAHVDVEALHLRVPLRRQFDRRP